MCLQCAARGSREGKVSHTFENNTNAMQCNANQTNTVRVSDVRVDCLLQYMHITHGCCIMIMLIARSRTRYHHFQLSFWQSESVDLCKVYA